MVVLLGLVCYAIYVYLCLEFYYSIGGLHKSPIPIYGVQPSLKMICYTMSNRAGFRFVEVGPDKLG